MARLPFVTREDFPEELKYVWDANARNGDVANIFRTMGNNPGVLRAYQRLGNGLWNLSGIDLQTRELLILRVAILQHSQYEWHQHVRIGRAAGLTNDRIVALHHWKTSEAFSDAERAMLAYVDGVLSTDHPSQELHDQLLAHFSPAAAVGINLLAGYYMMTAKFLGSMEVETEEPFVGWHLE